MTNKELAEVSLHNALLLRSRANIPLYARVESFPSPDQDLVQTFGADGQPISVQSRSTWEDLARVARAQLGIVETT